MATRLEVYNLNGNKYAKIAINNINYGETYENIVAMKQNEKIYIRVCDDISNEK